MGIAQFSAMIQKHIVSQLSDKKTNPLEGISSEAIRSTLEKAKYHNAIFTRASFDTLKEQFSDSSNKFKLTNTSGFMTAEQSGKVLADSIIVLNAIDFDEFVTWVSERKGRKTSVETGRGIDTKIVSSNLSYEERGATSTYYKSSTDKATLVLSNISQGGLKNLLIKYIQEVLTRNPELKSPLKNKDVIPFIKLNLQAGHLAGVFSLRIKNLFGAQYDETTGSFSLPTDSKELSKQVNSIMRLLLDADHFTSNLPNHHKVFVKSEKLMFGSDTKAVTELQLAGINEIAGQSMVGLGVVIANIEKLVKDPTIPSRDEKINSSIKSLLNALKPVIEDIKKAHSNLKLTDKASKAALEKALKNADFIDGLLNTPSSPSLIDSISTGIANLVKTGKKLPAMKVTIRQNSNIKSELAETLKQNVSNTLKAVTKTSKAINSVKAKKGPKEVQITKRVSKTAKPTYSLANLQTLLNSALQQQIKKNMVKPALQNRTGRFAESVRVERLSESRAGMITAFYSYMKSPYQTFEPGFRQGSPARNPKTLISKSIREIAAGIVGNRLRAVRL